MADRMKGKRGVTTAGAHSVGEASADLAAPDGLLGGRPVAVIGAGLVGAGWAIVFARAGLDVRV
jgi:S-adenosylhomocysteine hydrolase